MVKESVITLEQKAPSERFQRIKKELLSTPVHLCPERAVIITDYFKHHDKHSEPMVIRKSRALRYLLQHKSVHIYPDELIVGNMGSHRISALIQPELSGDKGVNILSGLMKGFFSSGGMELQLNVLDPEMLKDARRNPGKYPGSWWYVYRAIAPISMTSPMPQSSR